ncbi:MAG: vitamin K epoxide reductase family protein [Candidatus Doudnabacteria bacterium]|nr:vitamin K epoxide reductase family protein [Candidatus Doudnabacteria bacterium]
MKTLSNKLFVLILFLALLGLADATYLTVSHYTSQGVSCSLTNGCEAVLTSKYATVLGLPIALFGIGYYAAIFFLVYYYKQNETRRIWDIVAILSSLGFVTTLYLVYLQVFVIRAICQYCIVSAGLTTMIVIIILINWFVKKRVS